MGIIILWKVLCKLWSLGSKEESGSYLSRKRGNRDGNERCNTASGAEGGGLPIRNSGAHWMVGKGQRAEVRSLIDSEVNPHCHVACLGKKIRPRTHVFIQALSVWLSLRDPEEKHPNPQKISI